MRTDGMDVGVVVRSRREAKGLVGYLGDGCLRKHNSTLSYSYRLVTETRTLLPVDDESWFRGKTTSELFSSNLTQPVDGALSRDLEITLPRPGSSL